MGFKVCESEIRTFWANTDGSSVYYLGQIVVYTVAAKAVPIGAVVPLAVPAGTADLTNYQCIAGIVVGFNTNSPAYSASAVAGQYPQTVTGVITSAAQVARLGTIQGAEGMYAKGDPQVLVKIAEITPNTIIEGPICSSTGAAPTVISDTVGTDSTGYTTAGTTTATQFTPVAHQATIYCRTGKNAGLYRVTADTSTTGPDCDIAWPYNVALGDTFVHVPVKQGISYIYIGGPGMYIDSTASAATNHFNVFVYELDLSTAGKEVARFRFATMHFDNSRA